MLLFVSDVSLGVVVVVADIFVIVTIPGVVVVRPVRVIVVGILAVAVFVAICLRLLEHSARVERLEWWKGWLLSSGAFLLADVLVIVVLVVVLVVVVVLFVVDVVVVVFAAAVFVFWFLFLLLFPISPPRTRLLGGVVCGREEGVLGVVACFLPPSPSPHHPPGS